MWFRTAALACPPVLRQVKWLRNLPLTDAAWHGWTKLMCDIRRRGIWFLSTMPAGARGPSQVTGSGHVNSMTHRSRVRERNVLETYIHTLPRHPGNLFSVFSVQLWIKEFLFLSVCQKALLKDTLVALWSFFTDTFCLLPHCFQHFSGAAW